MLMILYKFWLRGHGLADTDIRWRSQFDLSARDIKHEPPPKHNAGYGDERPSCFYRAARWLPAMLRKPDDPPITTHSLRLKLGVILNIVCRALGGQIRFR